MADDTAAFIAEMSELVAPYCSERGLGERRAIALTRAWIEYKSRTTREIFVGDLKALLDKVMEAVVTVALLDLVSEAVDEPKWYIALDESGIIGGDLDALKPLPMPTAATEPSQAAKNPNAVALGKLGAAKGGKARAAKLSRAERSRIAQAAARWRWANVGKARPAAAIVSETITETTTETVMSSVAPPVAASRAEEPQEEMPAPLRGVRYEADGTPIGPGYLSRAERSATARVGQQRRRTRERAEREARAVSVTTSTEITHTQTTRETTTTTVVATAGDTDEQPTAIVQEAPKELAAGLPLADAPTLDCPPHHWDVSRPSRWVCKKCGEVRVPVARKGAW